MNNKKLDLKVIFEYVSQGKNADYIIKKVDDEYYLTEIPVLDDLLKEEFEKE